MGRINVPKARLGGGSGRPGGLGGVVGGGPESFDPNTQATTFPGAVVAPSVSATGEVSAASVSATGSVIGDNTLARVGSSLVAPLPVVAPVLQARTRWENKERTNLFGSAAEFPRFQAQWNTFVAGSSDLVISVQGASHVDGIGTEGNGSNNLRPNRGSWVRFLSQKIQQTLGCNIGVFSTPTDYHWGEWSGIGNGWTTSYFLGGVAQGRVIYNTTTTTPQTFYAPDIEVEWDAVDLYYLSKSSTGNFTISATGGTPVAVNGVGTGISIKKATCYASTPSRNNVFSAARVDGSFIVIGATFYRQGFNKLVIMNCGVGGTTSGNWNDSTGTSLFGDEVARVAGASLTMMTIGVNDQGGSVPVSTYRDNYQAIVSRVAAYADFVAMPPFNVGQTDTGAVKTALDAYRDAVRNEVTGYRKFIDMRALMPLYNIPYASFSNQHPSRPGHRIIADIIWNEMVG